MLKWLHHCSNAAVTVTTLFVKASFSLILAVSAWFDLSSLWTTPLLDVVHSCQHQATAFDKGVMRVSHTECKWFWKKEREGGKANKLWDVECESWNQPPSLILLQQPRCIMWACEGRKGSGGNVKQLNLPLSTSSAVLEKAVWKLWQVPFSHGQGHHNTALLCNH